MYWRRVLYNGRYQRHRDTGERGDNEMPDASMTDCSSQARFLEIINFHLLSFSPIKSRVVSRFSRRLSSTRDAAACLVLKCRSFYGACTLPESPINSRMRPRDRKVAAGLATYHLARRTCVFQSRENRGSNLFLDICLRLKASVA